jgi:hypothetical protein
VCAMVRWGATSNRDAVPEFVRYGICLPHPRSGTYCLLVNVVYD